MIKFIRIPNSRNYPGRIKVLWPRCFNLTVTLLLLLSPDSNSQISPGDSLNKISAPDHIDRLRSGRLIVILPDYAEKIRYLTEWSEDTTLSRGRRNRILKSLKRTISERDSFSSRFLNAMQKFYRFSEWGYIWKSDLPQTGQVEYITLYLENDSREKVQLESNTYFLLRGETNNGADALVIFNRYLEPLDKPFPYFMRINSFTGIIESLFSGSAFSWKDFQEMVSEWDSRLFKFWEKSSS